MVNFSLRHLQAWLPWTLPYSEHFEATAYPLDRVKHDVLHVMKSLGRIAAECENHDHGRDRKLIGDAFSKEVADLVICALHIAKLQGFDLQDAVVKNSEARNEASIPPETITRPEELRRTVALKWAVSIFGEGAEDGEERAMRFIEEATELVNAVGLSASVVHAIVERIYTRQKGDRGREMGQAMLTLELLAEVYGIDPSQCADVEFARIQAIPKEEWERRHAAKVSIGIAK